MAATRILGEIVNAISTGNFVKVKGVGVLILTKSDTKRRRRRNKKAPAEIKK